MRLLLAFLWIAYLLNYCDRQVVYSIFPVLKTQLGFTNAELGLTGSVFIWVTGLASPLAGKFGEQYSKRWVILWTLLLWSAATLLTGFSNSPAMLLSARGLLGITEALFVPLAVSLIGSSVRAPLRSRAVALFFSAQLCGVVLGGSFGGWIAEYFGWRWAFFVLGIVGALFAAPLALVFRRLPEPALSLSRQISARSTFVELARIPSFVGLCVCFPAFLLLLTVLYGWLADFFHEKFSLDLAHAAFVATVYLQGGTAAGLLLGSSLSDGIYRRKKRSRFWFLAGAMIFGAPWVHLLGHTSSLTLAKLGAAGFGLASGVFTANIMVAPFDVVPAHTRTAAIAVINTIAPPFSGAATLFAGIWKERIGIAQLLTYLGLVTLLAGVLLLVSTKLFFAKDHELVRRMLPDDAKLLA